MSNTVNLTNLVAFQPVTLDTPLPDVYKNTMQQDVAKKILGECAVSTYQRLLHEAMQIANQVLSDIGGGKDNIDKVDYSVVGAKFSATLKAAEVLIDSNTEDGKRPTAWRQAKSDIYVALKAGHQLLKTPGIGQSALRTAKEKLVAAQNDAEDAKSNADHNAEHGIAEVPPSEEKKLEGDAEVGGEGGDSKKVASTSKVDGADVTVIVPDRKFKSAKLAAAATEFITKMMDLEAIESKNRKGKTGAQVALSACTSGSDTMDESLEAFNNAMAALALAKTG
jgi:hypothetical protein